MRTIVLALLLFSFPVQGCTESSQGNLPRGVVQFVNPDQTTSPEIDIEIARTPAERNVGLMYRKQLGDREGMLFIFEKEEQRSFWMKNTYVELDMVFLDRSKRVVSIFRRAKPLSEASHKSEGPALYVLEVRGGLTEQWNTVKGSELRVISGVD